MRVVRRTYGVIAMSLVMSQLLSAQWPTYPPTGAPKRADGTIDLNGLTPRTADGKPDFSGVWMVRRNRSERSQPGFGSNAAPAEEPPVNEKGIPLAAFWDLNAVFKDGLPFQPWAAELRKKRMADNQKDNPDAHCLPMGIMQFSTHGQSPRKMVQTPGLIVIMWEVNWGLRQIFMDGRPLPGKDAEPWWYGYSVGKWEGDTLVVETTGFRPEGEWLDVVGATLTDAAKVTERYRRVNYGNLELEVTVDDPKTYTKPWTVVINEYLLPGEEMIEFICQDKDAKRYVSDTK